MSGTDCLYFHYLRVTVILVLLSVCTSLEVSADMRFISVENGLSNSTVHSIIQDKHNYIWIATDFGLNRLSGTDIKVFTQSFRKENSLPNNYTFSIFEDSHDNFWVGTLSGLFKYDRHTEEFKTCFTKEYPSMSNAKISCIVEDQTGHVWMSVSGHGLLCINLADSTSALVNTEEFRSLDITSLLCLEQNEIWLATKYDGVKIYHTDTRQLEDINSLYPLNRMLEENPIFSLCEDKSGNVLLASLGGGLFSIDITTRKACIVNWMADGSAAKLVHSVLRDRQNRIWVGTDGKGLWLLDKEKKELTPYYLRNFGFDPLLGKVQCLYEDKQGNIWASYVDKGVVIIPAKDNGFKIVENNPYSQLNITDQSIVALLIDNEQKLWMGTNGGGLYRLKSSGNHSGYIVDERVLPEENVITVLFEDSRGSIYIGTYLNGFYVYNPLTKSKKAYRREFPRTINCNHITGFAEDRNGMIWISTNGGGINRMNPLTNEFSYFRQSESNSDKGLISDWCNNLYIDNNQKLWVGTYAGISCMDLQTNQIQTYTQGNSELNNNGVEAIIADRENNIWIGTNLGLNRIQAKTNKIDLYTTEQGLPDNVVVGFQLDASGHVWAYTNSGIAKYDEANDNFTGYTIYDGLNNLEYKSRATAIDQSGNLYFGGSRGITWFHPDRLGVDEPILGLVLSRFSLFNESVSIGKAYHKNIILKKALEETDEITLDYNQNNFSINFDALEYTLPKRVKYEYILKGLDRNWQSIQRGSQIAVYTNVPPGNYTFMVKAFASGTNQHLASLQLYISPPWWLTWWAKSFYLILSLLLVYGLYRILVFREREKQRMLEQEHNEELAQSKLQFFTDISHEIRTPLTLVISPLLKLMQDNKSSEQVQVYQIMYRNATRILRLVNQLLDIRKIDRKQMHLRIRETDIVSFINDIADSFSPLCIDKDIQLTFSSGQIPDAVWVDVDFIDKIIYNLLSNAFKFTDRNGKIMIHLQISDKDRLEIRVTDNGRGISSEYIQSIFERFYQVNEPQGVKGFGTGIGLHLTKMLVELHHGEIEVSSVINEGSVFTVSIPYKMSDYRKDEVSDNSMEYNMFVEAIPLLPDLQEKAGGLSDDIRSKSKPLLLVVEDNVDIRSLLKHELQQRFSILEASDGKKGYEQATQYIPDLIITDIMMPEVDGIEMTKRLRNNNNTRQIPVIMLTACTTMDNSIEGVEAGADVYISKPFDLRYLIANIVNLLNRQTIRKSKHAIDHPIETANFQIKSADDKLMEKLNNLIRERLSDSSLSIEAISEELGISRVHLHRKLKELTKLTPSIYLRNIRLEHAAQLLKTQKVSIAEVAYAVGFGSHQYFSNCFKDFYGLAPAEYAEKYREAMQEG